MASLSCYTLTYQQSSLLWETILPQLKSLENYSGNMQMNTSQILHMTSKPNKNDNWVLLEALPGQAKPLQASWKGPFQIILVIPTATTLLGFSSGIHLSRLMLTTPPPKEEHLPSEPPQYTSQPTAYTSQTALQKGQSPSMSTWKKASLALS